MRQTELTKPTAVYAKSWRASKSKTGLGFRVQGFYGMLGLQGLGLSDIMVLMLTALVSPQCLDKTVQHTQ